jgi:AraC family transcriptional regulator of adaptative response/methylated-DNA-[protein]-cysteine methyltransferase
MLAAQSSSEPATEDAALLRAASDYDVVRRAIAHIRGNWRQQPEIETIAEAAGVTATELHHLFRRWAGLSPKAFLQALTLDHARQLLRDSASVLDTTFAVGLSGPARLHDLFVTHEAMSPGQWKSGGVGLTLHFGFHASPFGRALAMATGRGLAGLAFADPGDEQSALSDMRARWPQADYVEAPERIAPLVQRVFDPARWRAEAPLRIVMIGTDFEIRVWETLLRVPIGRLTTYSDIAAKVCTPAAARAVGAAVGRNPISFVVPCHRVIGRNGNLTGYHWGLTRKRAILGWEAGHAGSGLRNLAPDCGAD